MAQAATDRCNCCGSRLAASDEGFDGVCALCAIASDTSPRSKRRQTLHDFIGTQTIDHAAIEWVAGLIGA